jgi:hypothetical protein
VSSKALWRKDGGLKLIKVLVIINNDDSLRFRSSKLHFVAISREMTAQIRLMGKVLIANAAMEICASLLHHSLVPM